MKNVGCSPLPDGSTVTGTTWYHLVPLGTADLWRFSGIILLGYAECENVAVVPSQFSAGQRDQTLYHSQVKERQGNTRSIGDSKSPQMLGIAGLILGMAA